MVVLEDRRSTLKYEEYKDEEDSIMGHDRIEIEDEKVNEVLVESVSNTADIIVENLQLTPKEVACSPKENSPLITSVEKIEVPQFSLDIIKKDSFPN